VAWCAVGLRDEFVGLEASEILAPVDDQPVWSIGCFFIKKRYRLQRVSVQLLQAAVQYIEAQGGSIIEGYPLVPISEKIPVAFAWTGFESAFKEVGFTEVERRVPIRPIMRYYTEASGAS
jgi:GNAT superfamily N-acetyltransferase